MKLQSYASTHEPHPLPTLGTETAQETPRNEAFGTISSSDLLHGLKCIQIDHNGTVYRLQATKLGKLILTK
jgi:hemin uptake protein HemP